MPLLFSVGLNSVFPSLGNQILCRITEYTGVSITEVVFYTKVLVNDILVGLERILDYAGVGLERFHCINLSSSSHPYQHLPHHHHQTLPHHILMYLFASYNFSWTFV